MRHVTPVVLVLVAVIHLLPLVGVLGAPRISALYGVTVSDPDLEILMRHRAVLFGLLGLFLLWGAWRPELRLAALAAGLVSVASFLLLAHSVGGYNGLVGRVVRVDWVALGLLVVGAVTGVLERAAGADG